MLKNFLAKNQPINIPSDILISKVGKITLKKICLHW
ncbi:MAG: hypothetical protein MRERC_3c105 [Mycoplasmataceae bacterium RC_NB112A]|nr:MAG: hypothetical protein MRERC_12c046 [Mycoplasmataceae bacterium RC_NB112A]KLL02254.1 MAG: hypothetical protein MRERC_3c105 [Mycoplasmataceae bacterium RC_NB112A]